MSIAKAAEELVCVLGDLQVGKQVYFFVSPPPTPDIFFDFFVFIINPNLDMLFFDDF